MDSESEILTDKRLIFVSDGSQQWLSAGDHARWRRALLAIAEAVRCSSMSR